MRKRCKTCFYWHQNKRNYHALTGGVYGKCSCGKFIYREDFCFPYAIDQLIYWDYEGYNASFATGPEEAEK